MDHTQVWSGVSIGDVCQRPDREAHVVGDPRGASLLASASVHWEVGNAFSAMLKRGRVRIAQVMKALEAYAEIPLRFVDVGLFDALELAAELKIYAYDAYVLACARAHRCPVLSLDTGLMEAAEEMEIEVLEILC